MSKRGSLILVVLLATLILSSGVFMMRVQDNDLATYAYATGDESLRIERQDGSFGGRTIVHVPVLEGAYRSVFPLLGDVGARLFFVLVFSSSFIFVYLLGKEFSDSHFAGMGALIFAVSSPIVLIAGFSFSSMLIATPIIMAILYLMLKASRIWMLGALFVLLTLIDLVAFLIVAGILVGAVISISLGSKMDRVLRELLVVLSSVFFLVMIIIFHEALRVGGLAAFTTGLPVQLIIDRIDPFTVFQRLFSLGTLLVVFASAAAYLIYSRKVRSAYPTFGVMVISLLLFILNDNPIYALVLVMCGAALSGVAISYASQFVSISKFERYRRIGIVGLMVFLAVSGFVQALLIMPQDISSDERNAYRMVAESESDMFFSPLHMVDRARYHTGKSPFIDKDFVGVEQPDRFYDTYLAILSERSSNRAVRILQAEGIDTLIFEAVHDAELPFYLRSENRETICFAHHNYSTMQVFKRICVIN